MRLRWRKINSHENLSENPRRIRPAVIRMRKAAPWLRRFVTSFPPRRSGFEPKSGHVGLVMDKVALRQVFSEYFGFPRQFSFHRLLHIHHHLSSGVATIGQLVADVPSGLSLTPPHETKKNPNAYMGQYHRRQILEREGTGIQKYVVCISVSQCPIYVSLGFQPYVVIFNVVILVIKKASESCYYPCSFIIAFSTITVSMEKSP
jgi:hypothetical protein